MFRTAHGTNRFAYQAICLHVSFSTAGRIGRCPPSVCAIHVYGLSLYAWPHHSFSSITATIGSLHNGCFHDS